MVKQKKGVRLIWKQKIWLAISKFLWSLTNQNAWFVSFFCTELTLFCTVFEKNCTALNQSKCRNFFMYIIIDVITTGTQTMAELCTEYGYTFLTIVAQSDWEEGKYGSLTLYACLVSKWNPEIMSQSKLDPFSCIVVHGPKKMLNFLALKKLFCQSNQGSSESLFMWKFWGLVTL